MKTLQKSGGFAIMFGIILTWAKSRDAKEKWISIGKQEEVNWMSALYSRRKGLLKQLIQQINHLLIPSRRRDPVYLHDFDLLFFETLGEFFQT